MPEISIVLPTYNGAKYIKESIESILAQSFTDWELIIVNDCSTDNTPAIVESYATKDSRIRVIHNEHNLKLPASLNVGFREARGRYFTWTSDDNMYEKCALEEMHLYLEHRKNCAMVSADMLIVDTSHQVAEKAYSYNQAQMAVMNCVGACFLYRAEVAREVGEYSQDLFLVEDYEYWLRLLFCGKTIGHLNQVLYRYRLHENTLTVQRRDEIQKRLYQLRKVNISQLLDLAHGEHKHVLALYCEMDAQEAVPQKAKVMFLQKYPFIEYATEYSEEQPTIIYGAGNAGRLLSTMLGNVVSFSDRDVQKIGTSVGGLSVISPKEMIEKSETCQIVIAVHNEIIYELLEGLCAQGLRKYCLLPGVLRKKKMSYTDFFERVDGRAE